MKTTAKDLRETITKGLEKDYTAFSVLFNKKL
jgi:hypothetical protein